MKPPVVIIGSGLAGYTVAREFRKLDKSSSLLIITGDDGGFYSKPMLSNAFAQGKHAASLVSQSADQMAEQLGAIILTHTQVLDIRHADKLVVTSSGEFEFQQLVLAVGAQAIRLPIKGDAADQVLSVNNLKDYALLREKMQQTGTTAHVTILGAGLIGCEFADDLTSGGHTVTLVDPNATPLAALAPASISQGLHNALENKRIDLKLGTTASSIDTDQQRLRVSLANGEHIVTDVVLSAVGLRPDIRLANNAQLRTDRGILVDQNGQTSAGGIFALGDCAQYTLADGSQCTLPYVAPLMSAARAIARSLCGELTP
ncbi:MAG: FAD-dependent oxidoreductase, partial [Burkholderiales bacterium]|nr:FAD-dependent oxidoreductase [Burkholderiales bacterium]